ALAQETIEPGEAELIDSILNASLERLHRQFPPGTRPVLRDAHPKAHGLVNAQFIVLDNLPEDLRSGVFKQPRTFDALIRFSAGNVEVQEDTMPQAAGMAIKLLGVEGEKLLESEQNATTQDFVMINFPTFFVRNLQDYELLHQDLLNGRLEKFFETRPAELKAIMGMRSQPFFNPVQVRYWSQTPYLLGTNAIKFSAIPISRTTNQPPETMGPNFLREVMKQQVGSEDVYYEFAVQRQTDPATMPVEDPLELWDEAASPFQQVAIIRIPKQDIDAEGRVEIAENLAFTPWHSLPEHRPLGSMNRSRRPIYTAIAEFRRKTNNVSLDEPTQIPWER
ncbi:MAG TPA: catalase family protein, partial [Allocoleopsis sp.]